MNARSKKIIATVAAGVMTFGLTSCKTMEEFTKSVNETVGSGGGGAIVGFGSYLACKQAGGESGKCLAVAGVAGLITYAYLKNQANKMKQIANVDAAPCEAENSGNEAYCVNISEQALNFASGSATLNTTSQRTLSQVAAVLKESNDTLIIIDGHTDPVGADDYNQKLSEQRAASVRDYFVDQGIASDRMLARGFGETKPLPLEVANNAAQRRVELKVEGGEQG
ncbi:OmpA family protein [Halioxenophilus sp. WMMB6]|uniref:OmpA family protein n=1 Tax=Halioxenophilus sp. WMMB6 TaxID=3073815 RepID=UPI00295EE9FB|nr:OmpA family protein [Halioxenophilus sp. WMMB6]